MAMYQQPLLFKDPNMQISPFPDHEMSNPGEATSSDSIPVLTPIGAESVLLSLDDHSNDPSAALLPSNSGKPAPMMGATGTFICLVVSTCIAFSAAIAFAFLFFYTSSANPSSPKQFSRPLKKLKSPVVLLVSFDGFRFGYQFKTETPNIDMLIKKGTEAETGLIPVFPTLTFPNHYSIVTGLYLSHHGIVNNFFTDPVTGDLFTMSSHEPKWWLGEPIWETVAKNGLKASTYFWPGSEVKRGSWHCPQKYCMMYNHSVPFEDRVDTVLGYFDLPVDEIPSFMSLYFEDPDSEGHKVGPDDPQITEAVARMDKIIGRLIKRMEERQVFEDVSMILVGDHGMVGTCSRKLIFLEDLAKWIKIPIEWIQTYSPLLAIRPSGTAPEEAVKKMNEGLESGEVRNGEHLKLYLKEDLPGRLRYSNSSRIAPIIGLVEEGYKVEEGRGGGSRVVMECGGSHGYDNGFFSMRTIFVGHGPEFGRGMKVASFVNVEIYNLIASILGIGAAPNNGSLLFPRTILLLSLDAKNPRIWCYRIIFESFNSTFKIMY